jgi:Flp pilus assembly protein TadG
VKHKLQKLAAEEGASTVITAIILSFLLAMASLTIDIGMTYADASAIQNVADAVALSLGQCLPVEDNAAAIAGVVALADEYAAKNGYTGLTAEDIILGGLVEDRYRSLTINLSKTSPTYLAKIIGVKEITSRKSATVSAVPAGSLVGCVPVGISAQSYQTAMATGIKEHVVFKAGGGGGENGFFGYIVIDGSNGNAKALLDTFKYGYDGEVCVGDIYPIAKGNKASVAKEGVNYRMSLCTHFPGDGGCNYLHYVEDCPRVMTFMIYDFVDSNTVRVKGFSAFVLEYSENEDEIQGSFIELNVAHSSYTSDIEGGIYTYRLTG